MYNKEIEKQTGIFIFDNFVSNDYCDKMIEKFKNTNKKRPGNFGNAELDKNIKNSTDWIIDREDEEETIIETYGYLKKAIGNISENYPQLNTLPLFFGDFQLQETKINEGFYVPHMDSNFGDIKAERILAIIIYLNDVEEGGETRFITPKFEVKPKKGRVVFFPSTWKYFHEGLKPISNDKYIMTNFVYIERNFF